MLDGQPDGPATSPPSVDYDRAFSQLCHLAALNRTDKVRGAIDNLVLTTITIDTATDHRQASSIANAIFVLFGAGPTKDQVQTSIDGLLQDGRLVRDGDQRLRASPEQATLTETRVTEARGLEDRVKDEWLAECSALLPDNSLREPLWAGLQRYLALAFRRHGAETVGLLAPGSEAAAPLGTLSGFLDEAIDQAHLGDHKEVARAAIDVFLRRSTPARTRYLAQLLDGTFTFFALTLDDATTTYLQQSVQPLRVFLDTNYIFGLLDLHDNFFVRASKELVRFVQENELPFDLYYHEYTEQEIDRTLSAQAANLRSRRWQVALSRAAIQTDTLVGLERLYHRRNAETPTDVDAFLSRYENVSQLLAPLGLKMYREGRGDPFTTREKGELIAEYQEFLEQSASANRPARPRSYAALDHDASVWIALFRMRSLGRSILASGAVFLTNDYWFYRFDKSLESRAFRSGRGGVVLPAQLLQLLRPLVPATDDFDRRFVETFALPEFRTAQSGYAATTAKVLSYLATYEDLPTETAAAMLKDHALAARVRDLDEDSAEFREAVESVLVERNRDLLEETEQLRAELAEASANAATARDTGLGEGGAEGDQREASSAPGVDPRIAALEEQVGRTRTLLHWAFVGIAGLLLVLGVLIVYFGPDLVGWTAFTELPHAAGLRLAISATWAGVCLAIASRDWRPLGVTVIGGLLVIAQLL